MGRKPRRKVFAIEGLKAWEKEIAKPSDCMVLPLHNSIFLNYVAGPSWWSISDIDKMRMHLAKIKADLLCESVAVSVIRSEFDAAEKVGILPPVLHQPLNSPTGNERPDRAHSRMGRV